MGRKKGSRALRHYGVIDEQDVELIRRLVEAYPGSVSAERLFHDSTGEWANEKYAANRVKQLRRNFGRGIIETDRRLGPSGKVVLNWPADGYRASKVLIDSAPGILPKESP